MAKPIKVSFGLWTWVGLRNHVLDEGPGCPMWRGNFCGKGHAGRLLTLWCKCPRPPLALWWHYCSQGTSAFIAARGNRADEYDSTIHVQRLCGLVKCHLL